MSNKEITKDMATVPGTADPVKITKGMATVTQDVSHPLTITIDISAGQHVVDHVKITKDMAADQDVVERVKIATDMAGGLDVADPVIDRRYCKLRTFHMGNEGGVLLPHNRVGHDMVDDYGNSLLNLVCHRSGDYHILDQSGDIVVTLRLPTWSKRFNGWTMFRGCSTQEEHIICKTESNYSDNGLFITNVYLGAKYINKLKSSQQLADYRIVGLPPTVFKGSSSSIQIAQEVHNVCVSSCNSGPKFRVHAGADYVFVYCLIYAHKSCSENSMRTAFTNWSRPEYINMHTLCNCFNCNDARHGFRQSIYHLRPPLQTDNTVGKGGSHDGGDSIDVACTINDQIIGGRAVDRTGFGSGHPGTLVNYGSRNDGDVANLVLSSVAVAAAVISFSPMIAVMATFATLAVVVHKYWG